MTKIVVLRHGRTAWNAVGRQQGQLDVPLDAVGRHQARAVRLVDVVRIVSSDLDRARETAEQVGPPVCLDRRLREQHYGSWQGLTTDEVRARWPREHAAWARRQGDPVAGEPLAAVADRALAATLEHLAPPAGTGELRQHAATTHRRHVDAQRLTRG